MSASLLGSKSTLSDFMLLLPPNHLKGSTWSKIEYCTPPRGCSNPRSFLQKYRRNNSMSEATVCHCFSRQYRLLGRRCKLRHGAPCVCLTARRLPEEFGEYKRPQSERQIGHADSVSYILKLSKTEKDTPMCLSLLSTKDGYSGSHEVRRIG